LRQDRHEESKCIGCRPSLANKSSQASAPSGVESRLQAIVEQFIGFDNSAADRIRHAASRTPMNSPRYYDTNFGCMPNASVDASQRREESTVFSQCHRRDAARPPIRIDGHADAGSGLLAVAGPRVGRIPIQPGVNLVQQSGVGAFACVVLMELERNKGSLCRIDLDTTGHSVGTFSQRQKIGGYPIRIDACISICS
jgi:hypothetical protein